LEDLQLGNQILKEYIETETKKQERQDIAKKNEKAAKEAAAERVCVSLHFFSISLWSVRGCVTHGCA